ncbi:MAG: protein translocase subunit SecF, partial [Mycobacterium sp.]|nr:protein translocase subunit SecF [Mycobacterium sp.]
MNTSLSEKQTTSPTPDVSGTADKRGVLTRLYTGTGVLDVIGKRRRWFLITAVVVLICLASMLGRGFTLGIDFVGGSRIQFPAGHATVSQVEDVYHRTLGGKPEAVQ